MGPRLFVQEKRSRSEVERDLDLRGKMFADQLSASAEAAAPVAASPLAASPLAASPLASAGSRLASDLKLPRDKM